MTATACSPTQDSQVSNTSVFGVAPPAESTTHTTGSSGSESLADTAGCKFSASATSFRPRGDSRPPSESLGGVRDDSTTELPRKMEDEDDAEEEASPQPFVAISPKDPVEAEAIAVTTARDGGQVACPSEMDEIFFHNTPSAPSDPNSDSVTFSGSGGSTTAADAHAVGTAGAAGGARTETLPNSSDEQGRGASATGETLRDGTRPAAQDAGVFARSEKAPRRNCPAPGAPRSGRPSGAPVFGSGSGSVGSRGSGGFQGKSQGSGSASRAPAKLRKYDREKFLQANFRFLVSDCLDLSSHGADPDRAFDWEDVMQVEVSSSALPRCPISLETPPPVPHVTPCGHVFALAPLVQHLASGGRDTLRFPAPCPICTAPLLPRDLRAVRLAVKEPPQEGQTVRLQLIRRPRDSIVPTAVAASVKEGHHVDPTTSAGTSASAAGADAFLAEGGAAPAPALTARVPPSPSGSGVDDVDHFQSNPFSRFVVVRGGAAAAAAEVWQKVVRDLADHLAQLIVENGPDLAEESAFLIRSLDVVAARARDWTTRAAEMEAARNATAAAAAGKAAVEDAGVVSPEEAGRRAAEGVKRTFSEVLQRREELQRRKIEEYRRGLAFPALPAALPAASVAKMTAPSKVIPEDAAARTSGDARACVEQDNSDGGDNSDKRRAEALSSQQAGRDTPTAADTSSLTAAAQSQVTAPGGVGEASSSFLYGYQLSDGQCAFIHPLSMRCLLGHFGSFEALPPAVEGTVLEVESLLQDEQTRRRNRQAAHVPLSAELKMLEIELSSLLPAEALKPFAAELRQREQRRRRLVAKATQDARKDEQREQRTREERVRRMRERSGVNQITVQDLEAMPSLAEAAAAAGRGRNAAGRRGGSTNGAKEGGQKNGSNDDVAPPFKKKPPRDSPVDLPAGLPASTGSGAGLVASAQQPEGPQSATRRTDLVVSSVTPGQNLDAGAGAGAGPNSGAGEMEGRGNDDETSRGGGVGSAEDGVDPDPSSDVGLCSSSLTAAGTTDGFPFSEADFREAYALQASMDAVAVGASLRQKQGEVAQQKVKQKQKQKQKQVPSSGLQAPAAAPGPGRSPTSAAAPGPSQHPPPPSSFANVAKLGYGACAPALPSKPFGPSPAAPKPQAPALNYTLLFSPTDKNKIGSKEDTDRKSLAPAEEPPFSFAALVPALAPILEQYGSPPVASLSYARTAETTAAAAAATLPGGKVVTSSGAPGLRRDNYTNSSSNSNINNINNNGSRILASTGAVSAVPVPARAAPAAVTGPWTQRAPAAAALPSPSSSSGAVSSGSGSGSGPVRLLGTSSIVSSRPATMSSVSGFRSSESKSTMASGANASAAVPPGFKISGPVWEKRDGGVAPPRVAFASNATDSPQVAARPGGLSESFAARLSLKATDASSPSTSARSPAAAAAAAAPGTGNKRVKPGKGTKVLLYG